MSEADGEHMLYFREVQRLNNPYFWFFTIALSALISGTAIYLIQAEFASYTEPGADLTRLIIGGLLIPMNLGMVLAFAVARLHVEVASNGLFIRFSPFQRRVRQIDLAAFVSARPIRVNALLEYGGYGVRRTRKATAFLIGGGDAAGLEFANGHVVVISSRQPEALCEALNDVNAHAAA